jgi:hypothetical protein
MRYQEENSFSKILKKILNSEEIRLSSIVSSESFFKNFIYAIFSSNLFNLQIPFGVITSEPILIAFLNLYN